MRRALREELAWRDAVVARLNQSAAAPDDFARQLEQRRKPLGRRAFLFRLMGTPADLTQDEFVASLNRATGGSASGPTATPRLRPGMSLQAEMAARDAAVAAVQAQTRQPTTLKLRPGMSLRTELAVRDVVVSSLQPCTDCEGRDHRVGSRADVDNSSWDGPAAMSKCANSDTPATCYSAICAGKKSGDTSKQSSWALPHHKAAGDPPNAAGVRNALARIDQTQGLTNKSAARAHLEAHLRAISGGENGAALPDGRRFMPRDNLIRGLFRTGNGAPALAMRSTRNDASAGGASMLEGHFAVFNEWTEIDSLWEGNFMESIAPGAFAKTFRERRNSIRVLFQHGRDPQIGDKPLGPIEELDEDDVGAHYLVPLLPTTYNADLEPGLRAGLYGASFRFSVVKEAVEQSPPASSWNPRGIPQRRITEMRLSEFGPVTFPAYASATAGLRGMTSLTDAFVRMGAPDDGGAQ